MLHVDFCIEKMVILSRGVHLSCVNVWMKNIPASVSVAGKLLFIILPFLQKMTQHGIPDKIDFCLLMNKISFSCEI